jgi:hypothetical protein
MLLPAMLTSPNKCRLGPITDKASLPPIIKPLFDTLKFKMPLNLAS